MSKESKFLAPRILFPVHLPISFLEQSGTGRSGRVMSSPDPPASYIAQSLEGPSRELGLYRVLPNQSTPFSQSLCWAPWYSTLGIQPMHTLQALLVHATWALQCFTFNYGAQHSLHWGMLCYNHSDRSKGQKGWRRHRLRRWFSLSCRGEVSVLSPG